MRGRDHLHTVPSVARGHSPRGLALARAGAFGLACASVLTKLLAADAPLPEARAALAAALPPQGSIARPLAQRLAERRPAPRAAPRTPPPTMRLRHGWGENQRHLARGSRRRGAPHVAPGRAWDGVITSEARPALVGGPRRSPSRLRWLSPQPWARRSPAPRMLLPGPGPPFFAPPPTPASLLASTAELILRAKLQQAKAVQVDVDGGGAELLAGRVRGVRVRGQAWSTPLQLNCRSLDVRVGGASIDLAGLATQRILLRQPALGQAAIVFNPTPTPNPNT